MSGNLREKIGILVGANARQEWLLPWWWENFSRHNRYQVSFVDFGLSEEKKGWCRERGELITLCTPPLFVKDREEVDVTLVDQWESRFPDTFWESREAWFRKPEACLQSPYEQTVWIDLDCEIVKSLEGLLRSCDHASGIALAKDRAALTFHFPIYNSGVIVFRKNHPLILEWAKQSIEKNRLFRGDQDLLSQIIAENNFPVCELDPIYNWSVGEGKQENVVIYHWLGVAAKSTLQNKLILDSLQLFSTPDPLRAKL